MWDAERPVGKREEGGREGGREEGSEEVSDHEVV